MPASRSPGREPRSPKSEKSGTKSPANGSKSPADAFKSDCKRVVFVLGGPGAGKGTQCLQAVEKCEEKDIVHFSAGDLLRKASSDPSSPFKAIIDKHIDAGQIVPSEITVQLLVHEATHATGANVVLVDGFPRNLENLKGWETTLAALSPSKNNQLRAVMCINLECPTGEMQHRILARGASSGRTDDNAAVMERRLKVFENETKPVLEVFRTRNMLVTVNAARPIAEVHVDFMKLVTSARNL